VKNKDNWISCQEELPKEDVDVICYCVDFQVRVGRRTGSLWFIDCYSLPQEITHWQKLPSPPLLK